MILSFQIILALSLALAVVNARALPNITTQSKSQSVSLGTKVTFQVKASSSSPPLSYQWRLNAVDIPQATTSSLAVPGIQLLNAGDYLAVVTDASGSVTSKVATLQVDPAFTKITTGPIATEGGASTACAWGDYNNDGWPDLFVNNRDQQNFLFRNKGDGTFEKITAGHMVTNITTHLAGVWGDYDNDGYLDMLVTNGGSLAGNQKNFLYHNNGDGTFSQPAAAAVGSIVTDAGGFLGAAWGDYDGDGFLDVFVAHYTGANRIYHNVSGAAIKPWRPAPKNGSRGPIPTASKYNRVAMMSLSWPAAWSSTWSAMETRKSIEDASSRLQRLFVIPLRSIKGPSLVFYQILLQTRRLGLAWELDDSSPAWEKSFPELASILAPIRPWSRARTICQHWTPAREALPRLNSLFIGRSSAF
jgi:hypothetical protein